MGRKNAAFMASLSAGILILALAVVGSVRLTGRPQVPWDALGVATGVPGEILPRAIVRADGFEVRDHVYDFNFIAARHRIGDPVEFVVRTDGREEVVREALVPFYANRTFPVVNQPIPSQQEDIPAPPAHVNLPKLSRPELPADG
jgi:hypothetical protein